MAVAAAGGGGLWPRADRLAAPEADQPQPVAAWAQLAWATAAAAVEPGTAGGGVAAVAAGGSVGAAGA